jgi:hypothetical protein
MIAVESTEGAPQGVEPVEKSQHNDRARHKQPVPSSASEGLTNRAHHIS